jgi:dihydroorotase
VRKDHVLSKCGWSPFEGDTFRASVAATFVNGNLVARNGEILDAPAGMPLAFNR